MLVVQIWSNFMWTSSDRGKAVLALLDDWIGTLAAMVDGNMKLPLTYNGKTWKKHEAHSLYIQYVAISSGPRLKSCQLCSCGQNWLHPEDQ